MPKSFYLLCSWLEHSFDEKCFWKTCISCACFFFNFPFSNFFLSFWTFSANCCHTNFYFLDSFHAIETKKLLFSRLQHIIVGLVNIYIQMEPISAYNVFLCAFQYFFVFKPFSQNIKKMFHENFIKSMAQLQSALFFA